MSYHRGIGQIDVSHEIIVEQGLFFTIDIRHELSFLSSLMHEHFIEHAIFMLLIGIQYIISCDSLVTFRSNVKTDTRIHHQVIVGKAPPFTLY